MKKFKVIGLQHPGKIVHPLVGTVELHNCSDKTAEMLFEAGCPYLEKVEPEKAENKPDGAKTKKEISDIPPPK